MSQFAVILPAAGQSSRFKGFQRKKPFVELKGRPIWVRTAEHFLNRPDVCQTILVIAPEDLDWFRDTFRANLAFMDISVVAGGASRAESVRNGISAIKKPADYIAVHDAARPLLTTQWVDQIFAAAESYQAAIPGLKISSTIKRIGDDALISATVDRTGLVQAQTPQVFSAALLQKAMASCRNLAAATDDASLVESISQPVTVIDGWPMNIKITTNEDFRLAELFLSALPKSGGLVGLHPFADDLLS
ncbi:MAG TPA: 2-C-methyl-D-erythritol 4-phosphate cytidylyltransferase [Planctomycetaceae bacterium]|nr:2-C-methyl-D-erythritol 4-phosphate cytidylyltransferase [Planctomycetaceae bacterium]HQZ63690.1 2-C-methyl-D-erythritol 4-phosphate cytidylyltransferase [Planctomycetaceae bacterium]